MVKLIYNGKVFLGKGYVSEALLIIKGKIVKIGTSKDLLREAAPGTEKIDAEGAYILPAFYDSHLHLMWLGRRMGGIECSGAKSIEEIITRGRKTISEKNPPHGTYVIGAGVNPDLFTEGEKRDLNREDIDKISTLHPIILSRHCGHTIYANSMALNMAGFSESAPEVEGGTIEKDAAGRPTGVFKENANPLLRKPMPPTSKEDMENYIRHGIKKAHSFGISSCGSYDSGGPDFDDVVASYCKIFDEFRDSGIPGLRVTMQCGISLRDDMLDAHIARKNYLKPLWHDERWGNFLKMGSVKIFADGTLGGHTAWMRKPYNDKPETCGFPLMDQKKLEAFVKKANDAGMQVLIHAIGDAGIDAVLTAFEKVTEPGINPLRHGIIHCQISSMDLFERIARNNIYVLAQPAFLADDIHILESRVGPELASTSYAWGIMHKMGINLSYGTDAPVSHLDPLFGINWAMKQDVDIYTAHNAYSVCSSFANNDDNMLGSLNPGSYGDLVFLDKDIFNIPTEELINVKVLRTICAGETVYSL